MGEKKHRGVYMPVELTNILGEFNECSLQLFGENDRKAAVLEVELELKKEGAGGTPWGESSGHDDVNDSVSGKAGKYLC